MKERLTGNFLVVEINIRANKKTSSLFEVCISMTKNSYLNVIEGGLVNYDTL